MIGHLRVPIIVAVIFATSCELNAGQRESPSLGGSPIDVLSLEPSGVALPAEYDWYDDSDGSVKRTELQWRLLVDGEPTDSVCGTEAMWVWSNAQDDAAMGDPTVRLYVCSAGDAASAEAFVDTLVIEDTVVPQNDTYEAHEIDLGRAASSADAAVAACVWGRPAECRAWTFIGRYGQYIIQSHWIAAGGGALAAEPFIEMVTSIDAFSRETID